MKQTVLIIGGGIAGIAAAVEVSSQGHHAVLVEQRPYLGGRARSYTDRTTSEVIDNGQHLMMGCYTNFLHLVRVLGTDAHFHRQRALRVRFVDADGTTDLLDAGLLPGRAGVALGILRLRSIPLASRLAALRFAVRLQLGRIKAEGLTCRELLEREHQPNDVIRRFWEPIILATLNASVDDAAAVLLTEVLRRAFFGGAEASRLYLPKHGLSVFIEPVIDWLRDRGGRVELKTSVESLQWNGERVTAALLSDGSHIDVDAVICAVPPRALRQLLDASPGTPISVPTLEYSPIISVYLWYDRSWMTDAFVAMLGTTIQWVFDRRQLTEAPAEVVATYPGHVALTVSAGNHLLDRTTEDIVMLCEQELRSAFPAMQNVTLLHSVVIKEKHATLLATPQAHATRPSSSRTGNIILAGDWIQTHLPATLEGAAETGREGGKELKRIENRE